MISCQCWRLIWYSGRYLRWLCSAARLPPWLRKLQPPAAERDLYVRWLGAEHLAVHAGDLITGRKKPASGEKTDPLVQLAVAQGKIAGYAGRLGALACRGAPGVTMSS